MGAILRSFEVAGLLVVCFDFVESNDTSMYETSQAPESLDPEVTDFEDQTTDSYSFDTTVETSTDPTENPNPVIYIIPGILLIIVILFVCLICGLRKYLKRRKTGVKTADGIQQRHEHDDPPVAVVPAASRIIRTNHSRDIAMDRINSQQVKQELGSRPSDSKPNEAKLFAMSETATTAKDDEASTDDIPVMLYNDCYGELPRENALAEKTSAVCDGTEQERRYSDVCRSQQECKKKEETEKTQPDENIPAYGKVDEQRVYDDPPEDVVCAGFRVIRTDHFRDTPQGDAELESKTGDHKIEANRSDVSKAALTDEDGPKNADESTETVYNECYGGIHLGKEHVTNMPKCTDRTGQEQTYEDVFPPPEEREKKDQSQKTESKEKMPAYSQVNKNNRTGTLEITD